MFQDLLKTVLLSIKIRVKCDVCGKEKLLGYGMFNINTRNNTTYYSCSNKCSIRKNNETNFKKYGVEYPQNLKLFKEKVKQTNLLRYGVESVNRTNETHIKIK